MKNHNYKKESNNQIPPLPVLHPYPLHKNLLSTSFTDVSSDAKTDCNLETSFNMPNSTLVTTSFNHSSHLSFSNTFLTSTSFNKPLYKIHTNSIPVSTMSSNNSQSFNNISDDLMTTSFGSLSLNERKTGISNRFNENSVDTALNKVLCGEMQFSFDDISNNATTNLIQENSFMSTPFNNPTYESVTSDVSSSDLLRSSLDNIDNNIMSTSFSTVGMDTSNSYDNSFNDLVTTKSDSNIVSSPLKSIRSSVIMNDIVSKKLPDSIVINKSTSNFHNNHSNFASTSFNFLENQVQDSDNSNLKNFNSEDNSNMKLQQSILAKKVDFNIPPPPSLTNSFTNYFQGLPKKNLRLSRSTSGLADIDESVRKFSFTKTRNVNSYLLQKQNSASNILQDQFKYSNIKSSRYKFNYDFDCISLHGSCDNIDMHSSTNNLRLSNSQFSAPYDIQNKFERHSKLVLSQNGTNTSVNKESKISSNIPPLPVISSPISNSISCTPFSTFTDTTLATNEKPKVKFSDTVTHILVPGTVSIIYVCK